MAQQNITLKARGLYTFPNALSQVPDGALSKAENVVIDRDGIINPRRGFKLYGDDLGSGSSRAKQLLVYKDRILRHWSTTLDVDSDGLGTFTVMNNAAGSPISITEPETGTRIKYVEANGNLYFTSSSGVQKISCLTATTLPSTPVTTAGGVKALDGIAQLNPASGWFVKDSIVAYRVVWGIRDTNTNVILGVPSERIIISNSLLSLLLSDFNSLLLDLSIAAGVADLVLTGDTTNTSTTISNITTTNISAGMTITGSGIPASTTVVSVGASSIVISNAATATAAGVSLTFGDLLSDTDYVSLSLGSTASAVTLYASLQSLCAKLDLDLGGTTFSSIPVTPASAPHSPATTGELVEMQTYYNLIVDALNVSSKISTYAKSFIDGGFASASDSSTTNVIFSVPAEVTTSHFYQVYRSALFTSETTSTLGDFTPDDELRLVFEANPTAAEVTAKSVNYNDVVSETFRQNGLPLYTNNNSGEGISQANTPPPICNDIAVFRNTTFYANTRRQYQKEISLLSATSLAGSEFWVSKSSSTSLYSFVASVQQICTITAVAGSLYATAGAADYFTIYSAKDATFYKLYFKPSGFTPTAPSAGGSTVVRVDIVTTDSAAQVALKITKKLNSLNKFYTSVSSNVVTTINKDYGVTSAITENVTNAGFTVAVSVAGNGESAGGTTFGVSTASTVSQQIDETARSMVRVINGHAAGLVYAYYISGADDLPGQIILESRTTNNDNFYLLADSPIVSKFSPVLPIINQGVVAIGNPATVTLVAHGFSTGNVVRAIADSPGNAINGSYTVTVTGVDTFTIPYNETVGIAAVAFYLDSASVSGDNETAPNRLYYSKVQQPEAVPIVNYQDVGPKDKSILRILPLRDSLFVLTEDGIYRLAGNTPDDFQITLFNSSNQLKATDSAAVLDNVIYAFTSQGIVTIEDTTVKIKSRPIENRLLPLLTDAYANFSTATFAVPYESDRSYLLFTVDNPSDTKATICYRWNSFTETWVTWDISKTCGVVDFAQDKAYLGAGDTNYIEVERKEFTRLDHADREETLQIPSNGVDGDVLSLGSLFDCEMGDVFVQTQYLTIAQFNRLLYRLDTDYGLTDHDYLSTLEAFAGENLRDAVTALAVKLDTDSGLATHGYAVAISGYGTTFANTQAAFNVIVTMLIADANTRVKNYLSSTSTVEYEVPITATNRDRLEITVGYESPFIVGPVVVFRKINTEVIWSPHHFGDPSMMKHISETTLLFEAMDFTSATASYSSDLSPGFQSVPVTGEGTGIWGGFSWGQVAFGGEGTGRPFRTFVPTNKQRCRYINGRFQHSSAFEKYALYGISFTFSAISSRGYR